MWTFTELMEGFWGGLSGGGSWRVTNNRCDDLSRFFKFFLFISELELKRCEVGVNARSCPMMIDDRFFV